MYNHKRPHPHTFGKACRQHGIGQKFIRINHSHTNGKAERVIRILNGYVAQPNLL